MNFILRKLREGYELIGKVMDLVAPVERKTRYNGYVIWHYKTDTLLKEIRRSSNGVYERLETQRLLELIRPVNHPTVYDIGANIGLISLNIMRKRPDAIIHCFEPGPRQFRFLKKNILTNNLSGHANVHNLALGSTNGELEFVIHDDSNSSGDGFVDTGRAGSGSLVRVQSVRLDDWWRENGKGVVHLLKIDTEGAELMILQNAVELISVCRPMILVEICYLNYEKYNLSFLEYWNFFEGIDYELYDLETQARLHECKSFRQQQFNYYALPKRKLC
jgi:FkbM family methyltransferase